MKKTLISLFIGFLVLMLLGIALIPKAPFSQQEKRYLAEFPAADWATVSSGDWGEKLETWLADHIACRDFFVGLDAYRDLLLGIPGEIRRIDGRLVEEPVTLDEASLQRNLAAIGRYASGIEAPVTLALVPSAGWATGNAIYSDDALIADILSRASGCETLNLTALYAGKPELFYRTDHHWTSRGAYLGACAIAEALGAEAPKEDAFTIECIPACFQGSTYSRSALWLEKPEDLELWHGSEKITVTTSDSQEPHGVFYRERLEEADKYTVFLDGNHPLVRLTNPEKTGKLLVIRDSYSNCLGPFLAESWGEVVMADLRYFRQPMSLLTGDEQPDAVLILYSLSNFLSDPNIVLLR